MTTNHIDQLTQWWDEAEIPNANTLPRDGDRIIIRYNSEWYEVATADGDADESEIGSNTRVLARAPEPKPAWHDAVAVMASTEDDKKRRVFERTVDRFGRQVLWMNDWNGYDADDLIDPVPLIEARVTDGAIDRIVDVVNGHDLCGGDGLPIEEDTLIALARAALGIGDDK